MHIAISTLVTPPRPTGVGNYLISLIHALQDVDTRNRYTLYVTPETKHLFPLHNPRFSHKVLHLRHDPRFIMRPLYFLWQNTWYNIDARRQGIDVLHIPNLVPIFNVKTPCVLTIHDLAEFYTQRYPSESRQRYRRWMTRKAAQAATAVIAVSNHSRQDLVRLCRIDGRKITTTYEAMPAGYGPEDAVMTQRLLASLGIRPQGYFFHAGNDLPHKNLATVVQAFVKLRRALGAEFKLVLAGDVDRNAVLHKAGVGLEQNDILTPGYLEPASLVSLYRNALAYVFPSLYEGFGLPLLEAMSNQCPVICSTSSCLPEIVGDAALCVDANDVVAWTDAMDSLIRDPLLRDGLAAKGVRRAAEFSWKTCAEQTLAVYESCIRA